MADPKIANGSYELGWSDGYAEGYGARLADVTEPFMPPANDFQVEAAARWLHSRLSAHIDYASAIGLVRGAVREGMKAWPTNPKPPNKRPCP